MFLLHTEMHIKKLTVGLLFSSQTEVLLKHNIDHSFSTRHNFAPRRHLVMFGDFFFFFGGGHKGRRHLVG